jgi:DNA-binding response OmpR family regulator
MKIIEALNKGARHYIVKPFKESDVVDKVESILRNTAEDEIHDFASR